MGTYVLVVLADLSWKPVHDMTMRTANTSLLGFLYKHSLAQFGKEFEAIISQADIC